jgi:hypothetical protein
MDDAWSSGKLCFKSAATVIGGNVELRKVARMQGRAPVLVMLTGLITRPLSARTPQELSLCNL